MTEVLTFVWTWFYVGLMLLVGLYWLTEWYARRHYRRIAGKSMRETLNAVRPGDTGVTTPPTELYRRLDAANAERGAASAKQETSARLRRDR